MNITVLAGGISPERDVSLKSGDLVAKALKEKGHKVILLDVYLGIDVPNGDIPGLFSDGSLEYGVSADIGTNIPDLDEVMKKKGDDPVYFGKNVIDICRYSDVVFMALHGSDGENGKVQAAFDLFGIKYTGADCLSSAVAMDKTSAKRFFVTADIPTPQGITLYKGDDYKVDSLPLPCVIKPASCGSSVGVTIANTKEECIQGIKEAFDWDRSILVEQYIKGREFAVGVISGQALPVIEIAPVTGFYDYRNKYTAGSAVETCPADIPENIAKRMQRIAEQVNAVLGIDTYARMDFIWRDGTDEVYCLEANTLPGMTPMSLLPQEAAAMGMSYGELCEKIIDISLKKYE